MYVSIIHCLGFLVSNLEASAQGFLERSHVYRQRQADVACTAALSIQTAWRALQARRLVQQLRAARQYSLEAAAAARRIQVRLAIATLSTMHSQQTDCQTYLGPRLCHHLAALCKLPCRLPGQPLFRALQLSLRAVQVLVLVACLSAECSWRLTTSWRLVFLV